MAHAGQIIDNPVSGERIVFRKTAAGTGGQLLAFDLYLTPDGHVPGSHVHPIVEESFTVLEGRLTIRQGLRKVTAEAGDRVTVSPGTLHRFANAGPGPAHVLVEVRPALRMEELLEATAEMAEEGRTLPNGMPKPLDFALFLQEFEREVSVPFLPKALVRMLIAPLTRIARSRGLDRRYRQAARRLAA
jgi:mannose-6-phosphate isomerase-like protein (cupin superfamily)